jgi:hypothetical protein
VLVRKDVEVVLRVVDVAPAVESIVVVVVGQVDEEVEVRVVWI